MLFNTEMTASCIQKMPDITQSKIFYIYDSLSLSDKYLQTNFQEYFELQMKYMKTDKHYTNTYRNGTNI